MLMMLNYFLLLQKSTYSQTTECTPTETFNYLKPSSPEDLYFPIANSLTKTSWYYEQFKFKLSSHIWKKLIRVRKYHGIISRKSYFKNNKQKSYVLYLVSNQFLRALLKGPDILQIRVPSLLQVTFRFSSGRCSADASQHLRVVGTRQHEVKDR